MNPPLSLPDKSRHLRLIPRRCLAIGFSKCNLPPGSTSTATTSSPSSLSMASDNAMLDSNDHFIDHIKTGSEEHSSLSPTIDRQSFSSMSTTTNDCLCHQPINCVELFNEFVKENSNLTSSGASWAAKIDLVGFLYPTTLLVVSRDQFLEILCTLWHKRILKAPLGYSIRFVGYTSVLEVTNINQSHFTPLAEALLKCIDELNSLNQEASYAAIVQRLQAQFASMELPSEDILKSSLNALVSENKLSFDYHRHVYSLVSGFPAPWDELESLSLSDNTKHDKDDDDFELQFKSNHRENSIKREVLFDKCKTISTETSSSSGNENSLIIESIQTLRRNSSSSNDINSFKAERKTYFKRSKSFKLNRRSNEGDENKKCICNEMIFKRQSLFSKLLKFGNSNNHVKERLSSSSNLSTGNKCVNFGSQFPEDCTKEPSNESRENGHSLQMRSTATQTVKSGPEDVVAVIMRQAGKHALARNRSATCRSGCEFRHHDGFAGNRSPRRCCAYENGPSIRTRYESRSSKKPRHKNQHAVDSHHCHRCGVEQNAITSEIVPCHHLRLRESKHRKRSASMRHQSRSNDYNVVIDCGYNHGEDNGFTKTDRRLRRRSYGKYDCYSDNEDDGHQCGENSFQLYELNESPGTRCQSSNTPPTGLVNGHCYTTPSLPQPVKPSDRFFPLLDKTLVDSYGNVLINNSFNVKIEIETSNLSPSLDDNARHQSSEGATRPETKQLEHVQITPRGTILPALPVPPRRRNQEKVVNGVPLFGDRHPLLVSNDIYREFGFDHNQHRSSLESHQAFGGFSMRSNGPHAFLNKPELNYTNSITALKEQIARAKANFFSEPLSQSTP